MKKTRPQLAITVSKIRPENNGTRFRIDAASL